MYRITGLAYKGATMPEDQFYVLDTEDSSKDACTVREIYDLVSKGTVIEGVKIEDGELVISYEEIPDIPKYTPPASNVVLPNVPAPALDEDDDDVTYIDADEDEDDDYEEYEDVD
jgi:hypothetical protein